MGNRKINILGYSTEERNSVYVENLLSQELMEKIFDIFDHYNHTVECNRSIAKNRSKLTEEEMGQFMDAAKYDIVLNYIYNKYFQDKNDHNQFVQLTFDTNKMVVGDLYNGTVSPDHLIETIYRINSMITCKHNARWYRTISLMKYIEVFKNAVMPQLKPFFKDIEFDGLRLEYNEKIVYAMMFNVSNLNKLIIYMPFFGTGEWTIETDFGYDSRSDLETALNIQKVTIEYPYDTILTSTGIVY